MFIMPITFLKIMVTKAIITYLSHCLQWRQQNVAVIGVRYIFTLQNLILGIAITHLTVVGISRHVYIRVSLSVEYSANTLIA